MRELWQSGEGCLSIQVLQESYINVTGKVTKPLAPEAAAQIIADLSVWQVHRPGAEDVLDAIRLRGRYQLSFRDAIIIASALQLGCQTIWSEDLDRGQAYDHTRVMSPF